VDANSILTRSISIQCETRSSPRNLTSLLWTTKISWTLFDSKKSNPNRIHQFVHISELNTKLIDFAFSLHISKSTPFVPIQASFQANLKLLGISHSPGNILLSSFCSIFSFYHPMDQRILISPLDYST